MSMRSIVPALVITVLAACPGPVQRDTGLDTSTCPPDDTGGPDTETDPDDTGPEPPPDLAEITGTVQLQLREYDEEGNLALVAWEDSCFGEVWPYGDILVAAWVEEEGERRWLDTDLIADPSVDGVLNSYSLTLVEPGSWDVHVAAFVDKWQDRVVGSSDPVGSAGGPVRIEGDGGITGGVDLVVDTPYWCGASQGGACPDCPPSWGGGECWGWDGEGWTVMHCWGDCADFVDISGTLEIAVPYNGSGQDGLVMVAPEGTGDPWYAMPNLSLTPQADGASGDWSFTTCANLGTHELRGAWDSNGNTLWEFTDSWGKPVDARASSFDTITIAEQDLTDLQVLVPIEGAAPAVTPELRVTGLVVLAGGFDDLLMEHPDATLWLGAMRYGFDIEAFELDLTEIADAADHQRWEPYQLAGHDELDFELFLAGHSPVHLGAWLELDNDACVGGLDEPAVWWADGGVHGLLDAGDSAVEGLEIELVWP